MAAALRLYPEPFRERFGASMVEAFRRKVADVRRARGRRAAVALAWRAVADAAIGGLAERRFERRRRRLLLSKGSSMDAWISDLRFGARLLRRSPGFTLAATVILALGIGSTTAAFGLLNTVFLQEEMRRPPEVVGVYSRDTSRVDRYLGFSYPTLMDLRARDELFAAVAGQTFSMVGLRDGDVTRRVLTGIVTSGFFEALGAPLMHGRDFLPEEERPGADVPVVILGHQLWRRLGSDAGILGQTLTINSRPLTVVGVSRPGFRGSSALFGPDLWLPTGMYGSVSPIDVRESRPLADRRNFAFMAVARLPAGRDDAEQRNRLSAAARDLGAAHPDSHANLEFSVAPLARASVGTRPGTDGPLMGVLVVLVAMAGIVMMVSALNVANMQMARAAVRRKELAVRLALGGSRGRLVRQLMTEGLLLALCGGAAGAVIATFVSQAFAATVIEAFGRVVQAELQFDPAPDGTVLLATFGMSVLSMLVFSVGPALRAVRRNAAPDLAQHAGEFRAGKRTRGAGWLVACQLALSLVLLTISALFVRMAVDSAQGDPGFSMDRGLLAQVDPGLAGHDGPRRRDVYASLLETVRATPGVEAASLASLMPFGTITISLNIQRPGPAVAAGSPEAGSQLVQAVWTQIGADYFRTLGLPMVHGREFSAADERRGDEGVAIIDQVTAERLFAGTDPVGQFIQHAGSGAGEPPVRLEVIGVARPIRHQQIDLAPGPHVYTLYAANPPGSAFVQVRSLAGTADSEAALMSALRRRIQAALPDLPVISIVSLSTFRDEALMVTILRLGATAFVGFAVMALLIATIGVYGVKAYLVTNRTREIGIRLTLGATPRDILRLVLRQGLGVTVSGVGVGLVLSWLVSQAVQGVVLNTGAFDLLAFAGAALVLGLTVLLASWLPARRATRVAPTTFSRS